MGLKKFVRTVLPKAIDATSQIDINGNVPAHLGAIAVRQVALGGAGWLVGQGYVQDDQQAQVAGLIGFALIGGYGQLKSWLDRRKAKELAERAPNAKVT